MYHDKPTLPVSLLYSLASNYQLIFETIGGYESTIHLDKILENETVNYGLSILNQYVFTLTKEFQENRVQDNSRLDVHRNLIDSLETRIRQLENHTDLYLKDDSNE